MSRPDELYQWIDTVVMRFPSLSKPQATGLALWSFGMILARSCSLSAVADMLAPLLEQSFNTVRERLPDTYREADAKAGDQRMELDVTVCWRALAALARTWHGVQRFEESFTLHLTGPLERKPPRSLADLDRSAARMRRCLLVWLMHLDRTGI